MWNLSVVLCVLLFGSAANSMDVDEKNLNDDLDVIKRKHISTQANEIRQKIQNKIFVFMEKAKLIHSNLVEIARNVEDASVDHCNMHVMNVYTNGEQLMSNVAECIAKDEKSLISLLDYCESLTRCSGIKKSVVFVDESFYDEAGNTETDFKRIEIKQRIYYDVMLGFGTDYFSFEEVIDNLKQLLMYCQAEERGKFYAATICDIISREYYIQKKIEWVYNLPVRKNEHLPF